MKIKTVGIDLAENVLQIHVVDEYGRIALRKQLRRSQVLPFFGNLVPCLIGLEACASAHFWAWEMGAEGIRAFGKAQCVLYDIKHILPSKDVNGRL